MVTGLHLPKNLGITKRSLQLCRRAEAYVHQNHWTLKSSVPLLRTKGMKRIQNKTCCLESGKN